MDSLQLPGPTAVKSQWQCKGVMLKELYLTYSYTIAVLVNSS